MSSGNETSMKMSRGLSFERMIHSRVLCQGRRSEKSRVVHRVGVCIASSRHRRHTCDIRTGKGSLGVFSVTASTALLVFPSIPPGISMSIFSSSLSSISSYSSSPSSSSISQSSAFSSPCVPSSIMYWRISGGSFSIGQCSPQGGTYLGFLERGCP